MEQMALYREWRPQTFREVVGQEHVCRTLQNAVLMGRAAHAYLFCGPRGTGKTSTARILAKALNCLGIKDGEPCNNCFSCQGITDGISLNVIEMDAASYRGIEEIRDLKQKVGMAPSGGRYKVYIIDEAHMLTGEAFNALLKTLEEPPAHAVFILATTEAHKVPLTILSRCQRFDFRRLGRPVIKEHLAKVARAKNWSVEDDALELISRQVSGALRDALGLLDQAASFTRGQIRRKDIELLTGALGKGELEEIIAAVVQGDVPGLLERLDALFARGADPRQVLLQLADQVRDLIFSEDTERKEGAFYARFLRGIALAEGEMRWSNRPDLLLELTLLRLTVAVGTSGEGRPQQGAGREVKRQGSADLAEESSPQGPGPTAKRQNTAAAAEENRLQKRSGEATGQAVREQAASAQPSTRRVSEKVLQSRQKAADSDKIIEVPSPEEKPSPDAGAELDLAALHHFLINKTEKKQPLLSTMLPKCALTIDGSSLMLSAPPFVCDLIRREENLKALRENLRHYGCSLQLEVVLEDQSLSSRHLTADCCQPSVHEAVDDQRDNNSASVSASPGYAGDISSVPREKQVQVQGQVLEFKGDQLLTIALTLFNGKIIKKIEEGS